MSCSVQVLLATYNGERFLAAQMDSILWQIGLDVRILASDDGSTDRTRSILLNYQEQYPDKVRVLPALPATGSPKANFLRLIHAAEGDYFAFSDQDDVWCPDKLERSMSLLRTLEQKHGSEAPLLVFSDLEVVDSEMNRISPSLWRSQRLAPERIAKLNNILMQNVVTGCTTLLNRGLLMLLGDMPAAAVMHDWWLALVVCAFGRAAPMQTATVRYRQHSANAVGAVADRTHGFLPEDRSHIRRREQWEAAAHQGVAFLEAFGTRLDPDQRHLLRAFARCERNQNRFVRVWSFLRYRFFLTGLRPNLAMLWYLWDMKAAKRLAAAGRD